MQSIRCKPSKKMSLSFSGLFAGSLLLAYFVRVTIPAVWLSDLSPFVLNFSGYIVLAIALLYSLSRDGLNIYPVSLISISLISFTIPLSIDLQTASSKWAIWLLLFMVVGPFLRNNRALELRYLLYKWHRVIVVGITIISFFWIVSNLPEYGKGRCGITLHGMLLGPLAALASIYTLSEALIQKRRIYLLLTAVSILTCVISGARSALIGLLVGLSLFLIFSLKNKTLRSTAYIFIAVVGLLAWSWLNVFSSDGLPLIMTQAPMARFTDELAEKGMQHTRESLWQSRWEEFIDSPLWGIGMGVDRIIMSRTEYGTTVVEPGSSWLAILSMTGLMGAGGLLLLLAFHLKKLITNWDNFLPSIRAEIAAIGIFWSIHAIAEGWIFAGGSILCLFFWLWLGYVANLGTLKPLRSSLSI